MKKAERIIKKAEESANEYIESLPKIGETAEFDRAIKGSYEIGILRGAIRGLCRELGEFSAPKTGVSELQATYETNAGEYVIHFDYSPGEEQTENDPGSDPEVTINSIWANGMDVMEDLSTSLKEMMQDHCMACTIEKIADSMIEGGMDQAEAREAE